jgi:pimeloyl-ACP methyl ester carboxylesterase
MKIVYTILLLLPCLSLFCQERYVDIEDQHFRIKEFGKGELTVVFENGMSDSIEVWGSIPDSVATFARVFLYDRADIAKSDTARLPRTIPNQIIELRKILAQENIGPPYILVGHSLGGLITRYYSSLYPGEVAGLLLLDPAPEAFWDAMSKEELQEYIEGGNEWYETRFPKKYRNEWYEFIPNLEYMRNLDIRADLPIVLVSATAWNWYKYHEKIIAGFENARHTELEGEHHIYKDHPDLIVRYIKELAGE